MKPITRNKVRKKQTALPPASVTTLRAGESLPPDILLQMAEQEPNRREMAEYSEVIRVLREDKKFTFREIARWLHSNGVEADHNTVYREYTKGMHPDDKVAEAREDEATEMEERGQ